MLQKSVYYLTIEGKDFLVLARESNNYKILIINGELSENEHKHH